MCGTHSLELQRLLIGVTLVAASRVLVLAHWHFGTLVRVYTDAVRIYQDSGILIFEYRYYRNTEIIFSDFLNTERPKFSKANFGIIPKYRNLSQSNFGII